MRPMHLAILLALSGSAAIVAANASAASSDGLHVQARSIHASSTSNERSAAAGAAQSINDATATAVIGALQSRFDGKAVEFKLGDVLSERASLRDIALQGRGEIRFGNSQTWLPIRFEALYDTDSQAVLNPQITFAAQHDARVDASLPLDSLQQRVDRAMSIEFSSQRVDFNLRNASVIGSDGERIVVEGSGVAEFDGEGREDVIVQAIYDRAAGRWIDASYELGVVATPLQQAVASR